MKKIISIMFFVLFINLKKVKSECCPPKLNAPDQGLTCLDCTEARPYCGVGNCDSTGCNCEGGCRSGHSGMWCWNIASGTKEI
jgi:hypothetical protein